MDETGRHDRELGVAMPQTFEGFDFVRPQNTQKSAKDAFADLSKKAPDAPIGDKNALGAWFSQYIQPGMDSLGHKVSSVQGDKFTYGNHEGNFTVDYGRGAGAPGGALAWMADPADDATRQRYAASDPVNHKMSPMSSGSSDLMDQILQSLQEQQQQPIDPQAMLLQALR